MINDMRKAFTLIELLVVVSIIALLISILIPALTAAKEIAATVVCLTNQKGLVLSWRMYADDNNDRMVNGFARPDEWVIYDMSKRGLPWVGPPLRANGTIPTGDDTTYADRLRGLVEGALGPYTGQATDLYHCPGDNREVVGTPEGISPRYQIYRSYSVSQALSTHDGSDGQLEIFVRSTIRQPGNSIVFVEEAYDGRGGRNYNDGHWNYEPKQYSWWDPLAQFHFCATTFSFADGHAERLRLGGRADLLLPQGSPQ